VTAAGARQASARIPDLCKTLPQAFFCSSLCLPFVISLVRFYFLGTGLGGGQREACNEPQSRGQRTGNGQFVATISIGRTRITIKQTKKTLSRPLLGIVIYMNVHCSPAVKDDWKTEGINVSQPASGFMGQTRLEQIKRYFHLAAPDIPFCTPCGRRLWHAKVGVDIVDQIPELYTTTRSLPPFARGGR
jgi:hypothetical protein